MAMRSEQYRNIPLQRPKVTTFHRTEFIQEDLFFFFFENKVLRSNLCIKNQERPLDCLGLSLLSAIPHMGRA